VSDIDQMRMSLGRNAQEQAWSGEFGNAYTARNRVDWRARIPFWKQIIDLTGARSVYEFGCNAGWNLSAIKRAYPDVSVCGEDINEGAVIQAKTCDLNVLTIHSGARDVWPHELSFTAGVLIHIAPENLKALMQRVVDASSRWVLAVEYVSHIEKEIEYRGQYGLLWKRPYGKLYQDMGLRLETTFLASGFDQCHAWLLEKP
jgi:pseudaminic acid biosynthesis-associated methylase